MGPQVKEGKLEGAGEEGWRTWRHLLEKMLRD